MESIINEQVKTSHEEDDEAACTYAMQLVSSPILPMTLKAVLELDVLEIIAGAGQGAELSPEEIASRLAIDNPEAPVMLDRMLRLLVTYSVLTCSATTGSDARSQRRYGLAPVCKYLTRNKYGVSMSALLFMSLDKVFLEAWHRLKDAVVEEGAIPFNKAHGMMAFDYFGKDPRFNRVFNEGMVCGSAVFMKEFLERYSGFRDIDILVDVGGGTGMSIGMITSKYPSMKGINFDLPHVICEAPAIPGVEHVGGDMFASVPSGGNAIFLKWILHDWSDDHCLKLLRNCWKALPHSGKVIALDIIIPETPEPTIIAQSIFHGDLLMLANNPGGKERTKEEFEYLAKEAGFPKFKVVCKFSIMSIMEFSK